MAGGSSVSGLEQGSDLMADDSNSAVIVEAVRTPIGRAFKGSLKELRPDDLTAFVIDSLLDRVPAVDPASVDEVYVGVGLPQGLHANNVARIAALLSRKLDLHVPAVTVNRYCASSLEAIRIAANNVVAGQGDVYVAGGVEMVSRYNEAAEGARPQDRHPLLDGTHDGYPDAYIAMGLTAENVAAKYGVSREDQDRFAKTSQDRAVAAQAAGVFDREIVPVELPDGTVVARDDGPRPGTTLEKLAELKPVFREDGTVTAGNACPLNDGAAAVLVMSPRRASELGLKPRARVITAAAVGNEPELMGVAPIRAVEKVLRRAGMTIADVDVYELNEAFAAQVLPIADALGFDMDKLNPHGGAIALGHPFGMTGARIMTTLLNDLDTLDGTIGLETMCVAQGQGEAMLVERLS
jgi:acetyl-CoA C-acetyltransferase